jgi:beta-galactosidase
MIRTPSCMTKDTFIKILNIICLLLVVGIGSAYAQTRNYTIDVSKVTSVQPVRLDKMGDFNPVKEKIEVNNYYITKGGVPIIPITGEMHFTRYPNQYWDESIKKMKAGGINMIATYVFWNIHEEKEGVFNWAGDRNLRKFIELCARNNISVIVRIGPFDHGEIRNGGLPDWLLGKPLTIRTNDSLYLHYVGILYDEIGKQLKGLYYKDGGPVVGVQLENEYQHSASPWGLTYPGQPYDLTVADRDLGSAHEGVSVASAKNAYAEAGNDHMRMLKVLAIKAGLETPIYTATGWGYAALIPHETLPVTAAYAYPTWIAKKEFSPFYLYKDLHHHPDYAPVRYQPMDYPAFAAELGSGIMSTYSRRER